MFIQLYITQNFLNIKLHIISKSSAKLPDNPIDCTTADIKFILQFSQFFNIHENVMSTSRRYFVSYCSFNCITGAKIIKLGKNNKKSFMREIYVWAKKKAPSIGPFTGYFIDMFTNEHSYKSIIISAKEQALLYKLYFCICLCCL